MMIFDLWLAPNFWQMEPEWREEAFLKIWWIYMDENESLTAIFQNYAGMNNLYVTDSLKIMKAFKILWNSTN